MASGHLRVPHQKAGQMAAPTSIASPSKIPLPTGSRPQMAEVVEKGTAEAIFRCPLIEGADISLPPQFLLRRLGALGS